jgi:hypothetical protein
VNGKGKDKSKDKDGVQNSKVLYCLPQGNTLTTLSCSFFCFAVFIAEEHNNKG